MDSKNTNLVLSPTAASNYRSFERYQGNPILTAGDIPQQAGYYILNPGAVKVNGEYLLLVDVFHREGGIILWAARSRDGYHFAFDPEPLKWPESFDYWEENGVYDPRITKIEDDYLIVFGSHNNALGTRVGIVKTHDFRTFERISVGSEINNRNGALFPEKINGKYCRLDRPFGGGEQSPCDMWMSFSPDLVYWGESRPVMASRPGHWDQLKLGAGAPPIRTDQGWLILYHGVSSSCDGSIYSLFAALLDSDEPWKVIARGKRPLLFPQTPYERVGRAGNVVFTCNAIVEADHTVKIYYGAADHCIGVAEMALDDIIASCYEEYHYMVYRKMKGTSSTTVND